jgi:hypothetical protein
MVERYDVTFNERRVAKAYASPDLKRPEFKNVSVMPVDVSGNFANGNLELHLPELISAGYPVETSTTDAIADLLGLAKIEPSKVKVVPSASPVVPIQPSSLGAAT